MKKFTIISITLLSMFATTSIAADKETTESAEVQTSNNAASIKEPAEYQRVIDEYKEYASKIPASVRDEVIAYRKEVAKINKDKRLMYKKLSQERQDYLQKEQEYKKKLPFSKKALINAETPGEKALTEEKVKKK